MEISSGIGAELYRATGMDRAAAARKKAALAEGKKSEGASKPVPSDSSNRLDSIRDRMNQGFYNRNDVDEAITDKISGAFDRLA
jgi:hypothetical protein